MRICSQPLDYKTTSILSAANQKTKFDAQQSALESVDTFTALQVTATSHQRIVSNPLQCPSQCTGCTEDVDAQYALKGKALSLTTPLVAAAPQARLQPQQPEPPTHPVYTSRHASLHPPSLTPCCPPGVAEHPAAQGPLLGPPPPPPAPSHSCTMEPQSVCSRCSTEPAVVRSFSSTPVSRSPSCPAHPIKLVSAPLLEWHSAVPCSASKCMWR